MTVRTKLQAVKLVYGELDGFFLMANPADTEEDAQYAAYYNITTSFFGFKPTNIPQELQGIDPVEIFNLTSEEVDVLENKDVFKYCSDIVTLVTKLHDIGIAVNLDDIAKCLIYVFSVAHTDEDYAYNIKSQLFKSFIDDNKKLIANGAEIEHVGYGFVATSKGLEFYLLIDKSVEHPTITPDMDFHAMDWSTVATLTSTKHAIEVMSCVINSFVMGYDVLLKQKYLDDLIANTFREYVVSVPWLLKNDNAAHANKYRKIKEKF